MLVCPNKSSKEWQDLSKSLGEDVAMFAFIRNGNKIPDSVEQARDLVTNVQFLKSLETIPVLTEEAIVDNLINQGIALDSHHIIDGKKFYALNPLMEDISKRLYNISHDYGAILEYRGEYVAVNPEGLMSWNNMANSQNRVNKSPTDYARSFLSRIGVKILEQNDILERYGSNGVADFAERMVLIQSGKMDVALSEEALHFFIDMMPQDSPELMEALDKIRETDIYKKTLAKYKNNPNYLTKDGQVRFDKIKREALAKMLSENLQAQPTTFIGKLIKKIFDFIKGLRLQKTPYEKVLELYMSEDISRLNMNLTSDEVYNQLEDDVMSFYMSQNMNEAQTATFKSILDMTQYIKFEPENHILTRIDPITNAEVRLRSATQVLGSDFTSELEDINVINDVIDNFEFEYENLYDPEDDKNVRAKKIIDYIVSQLAEGKEYTKDDLVNIVGEKTAELLFKASENRKKTLFGTAIHKIVENIILDKDIDISDPEIVNPIVYNFMDNAGLLKFIFQVRDVVKDLRAKNHVIMTETAIGNSKIGGVVDIIAIDENGVAHIYDFKTKYLKKDQKYKPFDSIKKEFEYVINLSSKGVVKAEDNVLPNLQGNKRTLRQKYGQQQTIYKKILMEAGVPVGSINVIGVAYRINEKTGKIEKMDTFIADPIPYFENLANNYFYNIDESKDATRKTEVKSAEDERVKLMNEVSKPKLREAFGKMLGNLEQLYKYYSKSKNVKHIYDALTERSGTNTLKQTESLVKNFLNEFGEDGDLRNLLTLQKGFIEVIDSSGVVIKTMSDKFEEIKKTSPVNEEGFKQKIDELTKIKDFLMGYQSMFEEMLSYMDTVKIEDNPLTSRLSEFVGAIENVRNSYIKVATPILATLLSGEFSTQSLENIKREVNELIKGAQQRNDKALEKSLIDLRDNISSERVIEEVLRGERGDVGPILSKLLPTISISDPVLGSVARRLKRTLDVVRLQVKDFKDNFQTEFEKRSRAYGKGVKIGMKTMNESLVYEGKRFTTKNKDQDFEYQLMFKSEFLEDLYYELDKRKHALDEALKEKDEDKINKAKKELKDFTEKYFESDETEARKQLTKMLDIEVTYGNKRQTVKEVTKAITDEIKLIDRQYDPEQLNKGLLSPEHLKDRQELWERYYELMNLKKPDGTDKTGDELVIAKALTEYEKNKKILFEEVEMTEMFERTRTKVLLKYGESSEEYKDWMANNTRLVVSDEYYKQREALFKELAEITNSPNAEKVSELYKQISLLSRPYRDKDGFINASMIKDETIIKIKELEEQIYELSNSADKYTVDGYTYEEKERLNQLRYFAKNDPIQYDKYEEEEIKDRRRERVNEDLLSKEEDYASSIGISLDELLESKSDFYSEKKDYTPEELEASSEPYAKFLLSDFYKQTFHRKTRRSSEIRKALASMRTSEKTKYYLEELDKRERDFATILGISHSELLDNKENYNLFRQTPWFQQNHLISDVNVYSGEESEVSIDTTATYEPIYVWKRLMPVGDYIQQKPARHFTRRVDRESYIDENGREIQLLTKNNRDILNRLKPKSNDKYKQQYNENHPYLNKEYVALREKYQNNTATEREKVDYENLIYIHKAMMEAQEDIEPRYKLGLAVPFMEKTFGDRLFETKGKNVKEGIENAMRGIKRKFVKTEADANEGFSPEVLDQLDDESYSKLATISNYEVKFIPVRHASRGKASDTSYDVWGALLNYSASAIRKKELEKELALINGVQEVLESPENQPKSETKNLIQSKIFKKFNIGSGEKKINMDVNTRLEILKSFVNSVMFGEEHFEGYEILGVNTQKLVNQTMKLGSFTMLGLAPFNWTVNWLSGQVQNMIEASGGQFYDFRSYVKAKKEIYMSTKNGYIMKDMMSDFSKVGKKSFWGQVMEYFDPIQGEIEDETGKKTSWNKFSNILRAGVFAGKLWGEWEIQMSSFIAFMKNVKFYNGQMYDKASFITMKVGSDFTGMSLKEIRNKKAEALREFDKLDVNLIDILELNQDGKLSVKQQYQSAFELGGKQFSELIAKLHAMQKRINGSYAKFDAAYASKSSLGRLMFFFRKYFVQLAMNRFGYRRTDYESMSVEQGFYITFYQTVIKDLMKLRWNIYKNWNNYSDPERANIRKAVTEAAIIAGLMAIISLLLGYDDDDDNKFKKLKATSWFNQSAVFTLLKVRSETKQFMPLTGIEEIMKIYSNPSILVGSMSNLVTMFSQVLRHTGELVGIEDDDLYYKKDSGESFLKEKGDSKFIANFVKTFFGYTGKTFNPIDAIKSFEYAEDMYMRK